MKIGSVDPVSETCAALKLGDREWLFSLEKLLVLDNVKKL